ncbi:MAG: class II aldolase/adducin family protein [Chloroflexi bacterium]|nr:class II aldolase/adducin family protein [Chloroflexota bacterium]
MTYGAYRTGGSALTERALREEFVRIGQLMHTRGYVTATDGNISARLDADHFLATPSGLSKGFMTPDQMVVIGWDGKPVGASRYGAARDLKPSSEMLLHLEAYRQRPDVKALVHAHPPIAVALSIAGVPIAPCLLPEVIVTLGSIPTTEYATPASPEGATVIREVIANHDAVMLQRHGSVTVGATPFDAYLKLEKLEHAADITFRLLQIGRELPFPSGAVEKLIGKREDAGLMLPGQREELERTCGVCQLSGRCPAPKKD